MDVAQLCQQSSWYFEYYRLDQRRAMGQLLVIAYRRNQIASGQGRSSGKYLHFDTKKTSDCFYLWLDSFGRRT